MMPMPSPRSVLSRYGMAAIATLAALLGEITLTPVLGDHSPWSLFFLAIVVAGWWGGFGPALVATGLTATAGICFLVEPHGAFSANFAARAVEFTVFILSGIAISAIAESLHRGRRRMREQGDAIRASEERLRLASEATEEIVWDWEMASGRVHWSAAMGERFGWPDALPFTAPSWWQERIHDEDRERTLAGLRTVVADGAQQRWEAEYRFRRGDGSFAEVLDRGYVVRDAAGRAVRMIGATLDLTPRRAAEAEVRHGREQLRTIIDTVPGLISYVDRDFIYRWNSRGYERWFGRPLATITGHPMHELLGEAAFALVRPQLERALAGEAHESENYLTYADGKSRWIHAIYEPHRAADGSVNGVVVAVTDISERKQAELSQAALAAIVENSDDAIIGKTLEGIVTSWNHGAERLFGFTAEEMIGAPITRVFPADRLAEEERTLAAVRLGESVAHSESQRCTRDGRLIDVALTTSPIHNRAGQVVGASTIVRDITGQKRAEAAMLEAAEQRRLALEAADLGRWDYRFHTAELLGDERCFRMLGVMAAKLGIAEALARVLPADRAPLRAAAQAALAGADEGKLQITIRVRRPDGSLRWVDVHGRVFFTGAAGARVPLRFLGVNMDVTESTLAQEALRESGQRWRQLAEAMPHLVWTCRPDGNCDYLSSQWVAYTGRPEAEQLGSAWLEAVHPADRDGLAVAWQRAVTSGGVLDVEFRICRFDGEYRWFKTRAVPARDEAGRIVKWYGSNTDIEDLKRAEVAALDAARQRTLALEAAGMGAWDWHLRSGALTWSDRAFELFGAPLGALPSYERFFECVHPEDRERVRATLQAALATPPHTYQCEYRVLRPDGSVRWLFGKGAAQSDPASGEPVRMLGITVDVTERVLGAREIAAARDAAEAASRAKDDFLAALSHELRTPLTPVLFVAATQERAPDLPPGVREDFAMIRRNIELEARLIDDLLDVTRITRGKLQLDREPTDLHATLQRSLEMLRRDLEARHLDLEIDLAAERYQASADPVRLQQVFWNVLKNAVKFTPEGGRISVRSSSPDRDRWHLAVTDSGLGITSEELPLIFDAFAQGSEASSHRFGGLGLGLAISGLLVAEHHGRIWAESAGRHQGATFHLELPLDDAPVTPAIAAALPAPAAAPQPRRILIVEDHDPTRHTLVRLLTRRGYTVASAENVARARELTATATFDLMISDLGLPDGSGHEIAAEFLRDYGLKAIALSGYGMEEDVRQSRLAGFLDHLIKPVDFEALEAAVVRAWGEGR